MARRALFLFVIAILMAGTLVLASRWWNSAEQNGPREKVTISVAKYPLSALIYLAQEKGYFAAEGVDVVVREAAAGKMALQDVLSGKADLGTMAQTPIVNAVMAGTPLMVVTTLADTDAVYSVLARKDHGIASFADLKGKKIGLSKGTTGQYYFDLLLIALGIPDTEIQIIDVNPANIVSVLVEGGVDAIVTWDPYLSQARQQLGTLATHLVKDQLVKTAWILAGSPDYVRKHPAAVKAILRALIQAEDTLLRDPHEARRVTARALGMDPQVLAHTWPTYHFGVVLDQSMIVTLEEESRWVMQKRYAQNEKMPNFLDVIDFSLLQDIGPERVQIVR